MGKSLKAEIRVVLSPHLITVQISLTPNITLLTPRDPKLKTLTTQGQKMPKIQGDKEQENLTVSL